jgi:hypothetical protein
MSRNYNIFDGTFDRDLVIDLAAAIAGPVRVNSEMLQEAREIVDFEGDDAALQLLNRIKGGGL